MLIVVLLIFVAYILYADRKIWAAVQLRRGPNVVGPWGMLQAFADLLKFVFKEPVIPSGANKGVFLLAPLVSAVLAISAWAVIPVNDGWAIANVNVGILYVFAISSLEVYGVIMGGWASNSKYPFLGALRSAAQMVSYEVSIGFVIVTVLLCVGSLNLTDIVLSQQDGLGTKLGLPNTFLDWHWLALFPMFVIFFISALAETNRPPFDLVEAESELVAGHMVEFSCQYRHKYDLVDHRTSLKSLQSMNYYGFSEKFEELFRPIRIKSRSASGGGDDGVFSVLFDFFDDGRLPKFARGFAKTERARIVHAH